MKSIQRSSRTVCIALLLTSAFSAGSCAAADVTRPDALEPESFQLQLVNGQSLPQAAYLTYTIIGGRIKSIANGRAIDPRIFENRSGQGASGGSSRDSTTASAQVSDIREFVEHLPLGDSFHNDTSAATIERRGDLLIITRDGPIPRLVAVDTGRFIDDKLVVNVREWERFVFPPVQLQFIYSITNK